MKIKRRKINIDYIIIPTYYSKPDKSKIKFRKKFYELYNILYTPLIVKKVCNKKYMIKDGYTSYLIAKEFGLKQVEVYIIK